MNGDLCMSRTVPIAQSIVVPALVGPESDLYRHCAKQYFIALM